jgi:branched-chain amino acid transport system permease protein
MTATSAASAEPLLGRLSVQRWTRLSRAFVGSMVGLAVLLAFVPITLSANVTQKLTALFILVMLSTMWNALAGYGGMVSVGQQAYIGIGAYGTVFLAHQGVEPYTAMLLAILACGVVAVVFSFLLLRLRGGQFAIATWVVAEVFRVVVSLDKGLGAGTGISLIELNRYGAESRQAYTYWFTLAGTVLLLVVLFMLLRSRLGSSLQAIRDDEEAAASVGVRVMWGKRVLYVFAGLGFGVVGAMTLANTLFIQPNSVFGVNWMAFAIFMVLVGGLGTFEGPVLGAIILFLIQDWFSDLGVWYLIGLGAVAILFALFLPRGIWGTVEGRFGIQLMPVGYRVRGIVRRARRVGGSAEPESPPEAVPPV